MAWQGVKAMGITTPRHLALALALALVLMSWTTNASNKRPQNSGIDKNLNVIDRCWRLDPLWRHHRQRLARCSVGYAGKMTNNIGPGVTRYRVTDNGDDPMNPKPGTLRYGATQIRGKVWITFPKDMNIKLHRPLLVSSHTAIDGRGANVNIAGGACIKLLGVTDVIIHGLRIHNCQTQETVEVMGPEGHIIRIDYPDGDAISVISSTKVWIDHNTLYDCGDGLVDHMRVTVAFNYFGPDCDQRMPRVRQGFAHVVNNLYQGWGLYAIGGSMNPSVRSEANLFIAPDAGRKEITWKLRGKGGSEWNFGSTKDVLENGAVFTQTGDVGLEPHYNPAVAWGAGEALVMEEVQVSPPQPMEIRIKVVCTSLCRSDITAWQSQANATMFPRIFGHEAAGIVESVGQGVSEFEEGDHVLTLFTGECMKCKQCTSVSSFSEYTVVHSGCAVKVSSIAPLEKICLLSCGVAAGLGAAWKVADIARGSTVVIFGLGTVGLAVAQGAKLRGASQIIGVDTNPEKSEKARVFGITDFINPNDCDEPIQQGWGLTVTLGVPNVKPEITAHYATFLTGRTLRGSLLGGWKPKSDLPSLVDMYLREEIQIDEFITHNLSFEEINKAFDLMKEGKCLRCVIHMPK
ncbi:GroES-like zinc-binding dehydrogenase family protein [Actinidia rufa]|uniref:Pectate lyase n=1 Tax=Actinidia rufa TaxID=165716 RepID=A0A7J0GA01_9ERIC|nr:GroES-like zinc-binding dehydrogenase family protein [Actinidia rufa]